MDFHYTESEVAATAQALLKQIAPGNTRATVIGLSGDLGAGKTTLVQALARALGVQDNVASPTFVIAKFYKTQNTTWHTLIHIDAYRIDDVAELTPLGWEDMLSTPGALIAVEWPERILAALPSTTQRFEITHTDTGRHIKTL